MDVRMPGRDAGGAIAGTVTEGVCPIHALVVPPVRGTASDPWLNSFSDGG